MHQETREVLAEIVHRAARHCTYKRLSCELLSHASNGRRLRFFSVSLLGFGVVITKARSASAALHHACEMVPKQVLDFLAGIEPDRGVGGYPHVTVMDTPRDCPPPPPNTTSSDA